MTIKTMIVNNSFCKFDSGKRKLVNARAKLGEKLEQ